MRTVVNVWAVACLLICGTTAVLAAEGRTPIFAPGTVITNSGRYILTRNLDGTGAPVIQINTQNVDLDLNGFYVDGAGGVGIQVLGANEVRIHDGVIQFASVGIDFTPPGVYRAIVDDVRIMAPTVAGILIDSANNFAMRRVQISNTGVGADGIRVNNGAPAIGRIEACQLSGGGGRGISVYGGAGLAIVDNVVGAFTGEGIYLEGCDACLVKENTVTQAGGQGGIYVSFSRGVTLTKNVVARNKLHGIHVASTSSDARVEDNLSQNNGSAATPGDGILAAGLGGTVVGNTTNGNFGIGLHFASTAFNWTYGRNTARRNVGLGGAPCAGVPPLFFPNSCDDNNGGNQSFGDNLIPGPPLF